MLLGLGFGLRGVLLLSVPFSSGQGMLLVQNVIIRMTCYRFFQSPFHRGKECYYFGMPSVTCR